MRHRRRAKYFGVKTAHRKAMFRNMATSLFRHGRITTTVTRAKELRRVADKLITLAKEGSLHSRRQALSFIMDKEVVAKLFLEIAPEMEQRRGGYTRIVRIGPRRGDGAMMCVIELVKESMKPSKPKKKEEVAEQVAPTVIPEAKEASGEIASDEEQLVSEEAGEVESTLETEAQTHDEEALPEGQEEDILAKDVEQESPEENGEDVGEIEAETEVSSQLEEEEAVNQEKPAEDKK